MSPLPVRAVSSRRAQDGPMTCSGWTQGRSGRQFDKSDEQGSGDGMNLAQENFEAAVRSAKDTLITLVSSPTPRLGDESEERLQAWLWDLEAVAGALRLELIRHSDQPIDLGSQGAGGRR